MICTTTDLPMPRGYLCRRAPEPPPLDGRLSAGVWARATWTKPFRDIEGDRRPEPPLRTRAKMLWDDQCLYIAAELEEPNVWGTLTEHDCVIFQDNDFELFIDPDGDHHNYFELEFNALNTLWDLRLPKPYRDGGPALNEWEATGIRSAVHVDGKINDPTVRDKGWVIEIAIPWTAFAEHGGARCPPRSGDLWRMNFSRVEWDVNVVDGRTIKIPNRPEHNWVWSPQGVVDMHRPERWGMVRFTDEPPGRGRFRPDPAQRTRDLLMRVYEAQRSYRGEHGKWASSLEELGARLEPATAGAVTLEPRAGGWVARRRGSGARWAVTEDGRFANTK